MEVDEVHLWSDRSRKLINALMQFYEIPWGKMYPDKKKYLLC